ncbi:hypothetical protein K501DRAFT_271927 [Backusella circina FSU 941]|nr:hypothetical protein K501DRAFT_271927 [Backusella circina FSU 941]
MIEYSLIKKKESTILNDKKGPECISVKANQSRHSRDQVSALVVSLLGLSTLILRDIFPELITNISQSYTEFQQDALSFLKSSNGPLTADGGYMHQCCLYFFSISSAEVFYNSAKYY